MVALSRTEILDRARAFVEEWKDESRERAEKDSFWNDFLDVFGVNRRRVATFELATKRLSTGRRGFVDIFWPGYLIGEHKSRGEDLADALDSQALDYLVDIPDHQFPRLVVVSDFARFRVLDLESEDRTQVEFAISDLPREIDRFMYLAGYEQYSYEVEDAVNVEAAELLGRVYDELQLSGYEGHDLRVLIVRLLFLLFADDTGLWHQDQFKRYLSTYTSPDGRDLGMHLARLFEVLNTDESGRQTNLSPQLHEFPYVNGGLFAERISTPDCSLSIRTSLLEASDFDWSQISPAVFGSMFQSVMDPQQRRSLGAHYTSEKNIMKTIGPMAIEGLWEELDSCGTSRQKLRNLHARIGSLTFFDPACGCGNFLVVAYREVRRIETELLIRLHRSGRQGTLDLSSYRKVSLDQFFGIELEEFPARIAETAMYLVDHLENEALGAAFGINVVDLPLESSARIVVGNALRMKWESVLAPTDCDYVLGNPPFVGWNVQSDDQSDELRNLFGSGYSSTLDYVTGWYIKAAEYIAGTDCFVALVSTNSITQGDQVAPLWTPLLGRGVVIQFAHRPFAWDSEARGKAQVHCVIIGFSMHAASRARLYEEADDGTTTVQTVRRINPYLVDGPDVLVAAARTPMSSSLPKMLLGSRPADSGHLIVQGEDIPEDDPIALKYIRRYVGAKELTQNLVRYCIWIPDAADAPDMLDSPFLRDRISKVRAYREDAALDTRKFADRPYLFIRTRQPSTDYVGVPRHVTVNRSYFTATHLPVETIASDAVFTVVDPTRLVLGLLSSRMFMEWLRLAGGQIKSDPRFSNVLVYNTFPVPDEISAPNIDRICSAADRVVEARAARSDVSLADQYDPLGMSSDLLSAHKALDQAVDKLFKARGTFSGSAERVSTLFEKYAERSAENTLSLTAKR